MRFTDYLAIYAAILSTSVFLWNILQSRPRVVIDLLPGLDDSAAQTPGVVCMSLSGTSRRMTCIWLRSTFSIITPMSDSAIASHTCEGFGVYRCRLGWVHTSLSNLSVESGCPLRLEARKSHQVSFLTDETVERLLADSTDRRLMAHVQDQLWNSVYSRPLTVPTRKRA